MEEIITPTGSHKRPTMRQISEATYLDPERYPLLMRLAVFPMSLPVTVIAARLGMTPFQVSVFRMFVALVSAVILSFGDPPYITVGCCVYLFAVVLDNVDGSISRVFNAGSYIGKYVDGLFDELTDLACVVGLSLGAWYASADARFLLLAGAFVLLRFMMVIVTFRYSWIQKSMQVDQGSSYVASSGAQSLWARLVETDIPRIAWDFKVIAFIYLLVFRDQMWFLFGMVAIQGVMVGTFVPTRFLRACREFAVYRITQSATSTMKKRKTV